MLLHRALRTSASTFMPSAAPTTRSQEANPKVRAEGKPVPASASSVLSVPASGLLRASERGTAGDKYLLLAAHVSLALRS